MLASLGKTPMMLSLKIAVYVSVILFVSIFIGGMALGD
jgi:hypothetical protein